MCQGQLRPINQNQAWFSLLGNRYGGDGRITLALPDLRGRAPTGAPDASATGEHSSDSGVGARVRNAWQRIRRPRGLTGVDVEFIICIQGDFPQRW